MDEFSLGCTRLRSRTHLIKEILEKEVFFRDLIKEIYWFFLEKIDIFNDTKKFFKCERFETFGSYNELVNRKLIFL